MLHLTAILALQLVQPARVHRFAKPASKALFYLMDYVHVQLLLECSPILLALVNYALVFTMLVLSAILSVEQLLVLHVP